MGIENGLELKGGVQLTDSYLKIGEITISKYTGDVIFSFLAYKDKATRDSDEFNTLNAKLNESISASDAYFVTNIKPAVDSLKTELYKWAKLNGYSNFTDII